MKSDATELLDRVAQGDHRLSVDEAVQLQGEASTESLAQAADFVRRRLHGRDCVTYLVDRNINYTNVCITDCKFCEFYRPPGHAESYVLSREELAQKIEETIALGGTRILLQGGHNPDLPLTWYLDLLRWSKRKFPQIELNAFSPSEVAHLAQLEGMTIEELLPILQDAGMDGLPGGGGEILDDEIRQRVSPKKQKTAEWLHCMRVAHSLGMVTSASQVIGFGEDPVHRFRAQKAVRDLQDESLASFGSGFLSFVMWPLQYESRYGQVFGIRKGMTLGATPEEYLRHLSLTRLFIDSIPHLGASWPTMGPEVAMQGLSHGADDFGSTMLEENVVSSAGSTHTCMTEDRIRGYIAQAGYEPRKRDSHYRHLAGGPAV
ncbi:MAG: CofH family radical SAM protein [Planctomycetes bacterium]|nr:CofH family radical SAM protein [Planctomycetota bacterium]